MFAEVFATSTFGFLMFSGGSKGNIGKKMVNIAVLKVITLTSATEVSLALSLFYLEFPSEKVRDHS